MPGIESFKRQGSPSFEENRILNSASIPVIEAGTANIKLGVFSVVSRRIAARKKYDAKCGIALAYAVKCAVFGESADPIHLGAVLENSGQVLDSEIQATLADQSLCAAIALAYAVEIIARAWRAGAPWDSVLASFEVVDRASNYGLEIPNIVELWGPSAINTFFLSSVDFLRSSVDLTAP